MTPYVEHIVRAYGAADDADLIQGLAWYMHARETAARIASDTVSTEAAVGVIAALSPMNGWGSNIDMAERLIARYAAGKRKPAKGFGLRRNVDKAWRILRGEAPLDVLGGPKVRAFYANILGDPSAVTVDRWAARVARNDPTDSGAVTAREYQEIAAAYRRAAALLDLDCRTLQAAVWVSFRRRHARYLFDPKVSTDE